MKKPFAILLTLLVCLLSCMLPLRYGLKQAAKAVMHQQMQHTHEGKEAVILIAATDITAAAWEDEHEFRLGENLYDVAGVEYRNGLKYYRCVADGLETQMEQEADNFTNSMPGLTRENAQGRIAKALLDWLQDLYFQPAQQQHICLLHDVTGIFFAASVSAVAHPFLNRRIIPPES